MSNYGMRYDPRVVIQVILTMLFPGFLGKEVLKNLKEKVSEKTIQRVRNYVKEQGLDSILENIKKIHLLLGFGNVLESDNVKTVLLQIMNDSNSSNQEKIHAASVLKGYIYQDKCLLDPVLSGSISKVTAQVDDKTSKIKSELKSEKQSNTDKEDAGNTDATSTSNVVTNTDSNEEGVRNESCKERQGDSGDEQA